MGRNREEFKRLNEFMDKNAEILKEEYGFYLIYKWLKFRGSMP